MAGGKFKKWLPSIMIILFGMVLIAVFYVLLWKIYLPIPLGAIFIMGDILGVVIGVLGVTLRRYKLWGWEGFIFADARIEGIPVIKTLEVGSNHCDFALGEKKKPDDIEYDTGKSGVQVDATLTTGNTDPDRHPFGLNIYTFSYDNWLAITAKNNLAYQAIREDREVSAPDMAFLTDIEYITLLSTPVHHLEHDCKNFVLKYKPYPFQYEENGEWFEDDIDEKYMAKRFLELQDHIAKLPIGRGFVASNEAFKQISFAHSAQDLNHLKILWQKQFLEDWLKKLNMMWYIIGIVAIIIAGGVAVYIVSMAGK